jgi:hypothetical protein
MKRLLYAFMLLGIIVAANIAAQAQGVRRMVVNVPFDFVVGKQTLPAGTYTFKQMMRDNDKMLLVQSADLRTAQSAQTSPVEASAATESAPRLDFRRYGDKYFLARVWAAGQMTGRELPKSQLERVTIHELARGAGAGQQATAQPQTISVKGRIE